MVDRSRNNLGNLSLGSREMASKDYLLFSVSNHARDFRCQFTVRYAFTGAHIVDVKADRFLLHSSQIRADVVIYVDVVPDGV